MAKDLQSINITFYANEDGLKRVVCEDTDINLDDIKEEILKDWLRVSSEITFAGMMQDIFEMFTENLEEFEEDDEEEEEEENGGLITNGDVLLKHILGF